ncbi:transposase [Aphanothece hegewaldii CCALA 016]|uniref:Transposase n=1 Tax=Aphanothece hegewaldii CCALA 016 TaxID=2107694 RepID=A0A2T1LVS5_9CHRO|nr:RNA-guided endonuclease TnpB family protein [Aphanothece hegewaldii]PSF35824.1 transposase [Aphanothece hegewaldii CCALA 016]
MLLGFKTELKLNDKQRTLLLKHAGTARHAWNWGLGLTRQILEHNKQCPSDEKIKFPTAIDLHKWLVALVKPEHSWYYEVSKCAPQFALRHLRKAWDRCFRKIANPPKFKKKGKDDSFSLDGSIKVDHFKIRVPIIGWLKTYERLPQNYQPKLVTISRKADRWFISFKIEVTAEVSAGIVSPIAVDLGLLRFATLSDNRIYDSPRPLKNLEQKLALLQWRNRNKEKGSNNWKKAQVKIARLHLKIANIRKDFLHKLTTQLAKNHSEIVIEDLNVSGMLKNGKLAKAIADSGFYEFRRQLEYKTQLYGSKLILADRWFPSSKTCSNCGFHHQELTLAERVFSCPACSWTGDRDLNACYNLVRLAKPDFKPVGQVEADFSWLNQELNVKSTFGLV